VWEPPKLLTVAALALNVAPELSSMLAPDWYVLDAPPATVKSLLMDVAP